jgi:AmpD protein
MEGTDTLPYTEQQYQSLQRVTHDLMQAYPELTLGRIVGHDDIAPGRKTDPGIAFDWAKYRTLIGSC